METITANFVLARQTKGALKFDEVDDHSGRPLEMQEAKIGAIYLRKSGFPDGNYPQKIVVTVAEDLSSD